MFDNQSVAEYLHNKNLRLYGHYRITPNGAGYVVKNAIVPEKEFYRRHPLATSLVRTKTRLLTQQKVNQYI